MRYVQEKNLRVDRFSTANGQQRIVGQGNNEQYFRACGLELI